MGCNCCREKYITYISGPIIFNGDTKLEIEFINMMSKLKIFLKNNNLVYSYDIYYKNENGLIVNINNSEKTNIYISSEPYYIKEIYSYNDKLIDLKKIIEIYKTNQIIKNYSDFKKKYINSNKINIMRIQQFNEKLSLDINHYIN